MALDLLYLSTIPCRILEVCHGRMYTLHNGRVGGTRGPWRDRVSGEVEAFYDAGKDTGHGH